MMSYKRDEFKKHLEFLIESAEESIAILESKNENHYFFDGYLYALKNIYKDCVGGIYDEEKIIILEWESFDNLTGVQKEEIIEKLFAKNDLTYDISTDDGYEVLKKDFFNYPYARECINHYRIQFEVNGELL